MQKRRLSTVASQYDFIRVLNFHLPLLLKYWCYLNLTKIGRYCIMEGFSPDRAMLEASTQELIEEKQEAFEILGEMGLLDSLQQ